MKQGKWWLCGLAALLMMTWTYAMAQDAGAGGDKPKKAKGVGRETKRPGGEAAGDRRGGGGPLSSFDYAGVAAELNLSKEQSEKLTGLILNQLLMGGLGRIGLEDAQKAQVKDACMAAAKDVLGGDKASTVRTLMEKVRNDILTADQREKMGGGGREGPKDAGAKRGGAKEGGKRGGKAPGAGN